MSYTTQHKNYKWEVLLLLWMAFLMNQASRQAFNTVLPEIRDALSLTDTSVGLIATIFNLVYAFLVPVGGWMGDRFSKKWVVTLSIIVWSIGTIFTGYATGFIMLVLMRCVITAGGETFFGPANYSLLGQYHTDTRARAMSIHQTACYAGIILAGWLAGLISDTLGYQYAFVIFGAAGILWGIVMIFRLRDKEDSAAVTSKEDKPGFLEGFKTVFTTPTALMLTIGFSGLLFVLTGYLTWMPTYLHENFGQPLARAGFNSMFYTQAAAFVGVLIAGVLSDRFGLKNPEAKMIFQALGLITGAQFLVMMGKSEMLWLLYAGLAGFGFCYAFFDANIYSVLYDVTPPRLHSLCSSVMIMIGFSVGALAPVVLGAIKQSIGLGFSFLCLAGIWVVCGLMMIFVAFRNYRKDYIKYNV